VTETTLNVSLDLPAGQIRAALLALETQGSIMRGRFTGGREEEWCERRLLLRIHRYTRDRKRSEIQTVPPAQLMRFLFRWQRLAMEGRDDRREGEAGLLAVLQQLEGCAVPAAAWERDILPLRVRGYLPQSLDKLCAAGRIAWYRAAESSISELAPATAPVRSTPITLVERESLAHWQKRAAPASPEGLSPRAQKTLDSLREHGASFFDDLMQDTGLLRSDIELGLGELVSRGLVSSDSFAGLRALVTSRKRREKLRQYRRPLVSMEDAGRWSLPRRLPVPENAEALANPAVDHIARVLLCRYGVVFRKLLERETSLPPWRELFYVYRRMEARGEIRGGRFVAGFAGEQFALPDAATMLLGMTRDTATDRVSISAADPLNLVGIVTAVEDIGLSESPQRLLQGVNAEVALHARRHAPGKHPARIPVHDRHEIDEAVRHWDVRDVGRPYLIGPVHRYVSEQVRVGCVLGSGGTRLRLGGDRRDVHHPHQPLDALAVDRETLRPKLKGQLPAAVEGVLQMQLVDALHRG
jgi:ATP-dependent Lhr-like helicase